MTTTIHEGKTHLLPEADEEACAAWREHTAGVRMKDNRQFWAIHQMTLRGMGAVVPTYWPPGYVPGTIKLRKKG